MSRTEVQKANDAVLAAADAWRDSVYEYGSISQEDGAIWARRILKEAVNARLDAIARQDVKEPAVYLRTDASEAEKQAARAAMVSRAGWRQCIYELLLHKPESDRALERICGDFRGRDYVFARVVTHPGIAPISVVAIPDRKASHQSISSARKSLVDAGLVYPYGAEIHEGRRHTLWKARPL